MPELLGPEGARVFVDRRGEACATSLLYVHGGPGQGCWDFMGSVGDLLARELDVIGIDQPGVLRSDPVPSDTKVSISVLLDAYEGVRASLGIDRWVLVGHSAGGGTALDYALRYPNAVRGVIFDNPCLDGDLTDRWRLPKAAALLRELGRNEAAARCERVAALPGRLTGTEGGMEAMQELGKHYLELFFADVANISRYHDLGDALQATEDQQQRGMSHLPLVPDMYQRRVDRLAELTQPSLLLLGETDVVAPPPVVERYRADVRNGQVVVIERAGHFTFIEQPEAYAARVCEFVASLPQ